MKLIIFALLALPLLAPAQDIPKFSNAIIFKGAGFQQIKDTLLNRGFFIDQQSEQDGTIITKPKGVCDCKNTDFNQLIIYVRLKDGVSTMTGKWNLNYNYHADHGGLLSNDRHDFHVVEYWKSKSSVPHHVFMIMDEIARGLSSDISYIKQL